MIDEDIFIPIEDDCPHNHSVDDDLFSSSDNNDPSQL